MEKTMRIFRLFYAADDTMQPCVPATDTLIPRIARDYLKNQTQRKAFETFVRKAITGDVFHIKGKGKEYHGGILIVCTTREQLPKGSHVTTA
jgi:hypothetical protein